MTFWTKEVDMKRMLDKKLPMFIICWIVIIGMVLTSSPAFSRERNSSHGNDRTCERDRSRDRGRDDDRDRSRDWDRNFDWNKSRGRDSSRTVRVVHKGDVIPAIIATGLIAGITFSLLDNDHAPAYRAAAPVYCPATTGRVSVTRSVVVTAGLLNIRSGPGLHKPCVGQLYRGTTLSIVRTSGGWYYVMTPDGVSGWVMAQYTGPVGSAGHG
jgi:uncharacterized protein YgiM (DUF1202 family)